jgi:hypothetical protein
MPENLERIHAALEQSRHHSARRFARTLQMSCQSLGRLLADLKFHPYKMQMAQELIEIDKVNRRTACANILARMDQEPMLLHQLLISDEANFFLSGFVNKQNFRYWSPQILHEKPQKGQKVVVWCAVGRCEIIGPYFFKDGASHALTVNADRYVDMLQNFLVPELHARQLDTIWFQHNGTMPHTARTSMALLQDLFPTCLISHFGDLTWPSRSTDLTAPDYFLWGYLKEKVFANRLHTIEELKTAIRCEICAIPRDMLRCVMDAFPRCLQQCIHVGKGHLTDVIFKKH